MEGDNEILYEEKQRFTQKWIWIIIIGVNLLFIYGTITQIFFGLKFGNNGTSNIGLVIAVLFMLGLTYVFRYHLYLETIVRRKGIYVRFFPIQQRFKFYSWKNIRKAKIETYNVFINFGGWGIRNNLFKNNQVYNVSGNIGLQIKFKNSKSSLLIGTNKPEEFKKILEEIGINK